MPDSSEAGFTLVEVLVALVIAALLTAILLDGASQARSRLRHAQDERRAIFLARTLLTKAEVAPFDPSDRSGLVNHLQWTLSERVIMPDPRGQYGLIGFHVAIASETGTQLFAADARRLKQMPRI